MKPALLVIDVQKAYFNKTSTEPLEDAIEYINAAIDIFRAKELPVVAILHMDKQNGHIPGSEGFDFPDSVKTKPEDLHIHKEYSNAFAHTPLAEELNKMGVDTIVITGYLAEGCVLATYKGAPEHGFVPIILRNSIASPNGENARFVENISNLISYGALAKFLE